jgi:hypothetical protein
VSPVHTLSPGTAHPDPRLRCTVRASHPLRYTPPPRVPNGAGRSADVQQAPHTPAHVRAASGIIPWTTGWLIIQDDVLHLAHLCALPPDLQVRPLPLPAPEGEHTFSEAAGNKHRKPDLECAFRWDTPEGPRLIALGSGSTPARERALRWPHADPFLPLPHLYAALRTAMPDVELNIEGAFPRGDHLVLLQRGNGRGAHNAELCLPAHLIPQLLSTTGIGEHHLPIAHRQWRLGSLDGVPLSFTDGGACGPGRWLFAAAAEASPDTYADGPVMGSVLGIASGPTARYAPLTDPAGRRLPHKLEGICPLAPDRLLGVVDADDPDSPSLLLDLRLEGPWQGE